MRFIELTRGYQAIVDEEDYLYLLGYKWHYNNGRAWTTIRIEKGGKQYKIPMHGLIMQCPKGLMIDHINRNPLDNRKENLRYANHRINGLNRKDNSHGVYWHKLNKKWIASIPDNGKRKHVGYFKTKEEAIKAVCDITGHGGSCGV